VSLLRYAKCPVAEGDRQAQEGRKDMRLGWHVHLLGPFGVGGTIWQSRRRRRGRVFHGTLPNGRPCPHNHRRQDTADDCTLSSLRRHAR
jgi:hypothetical protein